jgi:hypothetical protein
MRATFITTALENGAKLEDVQKAAGHRDPSTTKLYDRREKPVVGCFLEKCHSRCGSRGITRPSPYALHMSRLEAWKNGHGGADDAGDCGRGLRPSPAPAKGEV